MSASTGATKFLQKASLSSVTPECFSENAPSCLSDYPTGYGCFGLLSINPKADDGWIAIFET
jgi:hypothetical protein